MRIAMAVAVMAFAAQMAVLAELGSPRFPYMSPWKRWNGAGFIYRPRMGHSQAGLVWYRFQSPLC